jgi:putative endonuclease
VVELARLATAYGGVPPQAGKVYHYTIVYYVYILKSTSSKRYYVGSTADLPKRLHKHNSGSNKSTKAYKPWVIAYSEKFQEKGKALARERQIKSYKGGRAFKALLEL